MKLRCLWELWRKKPMASTKCSSCGATITVTRTDTIKCKCGWDAAKQGSASPSISRIRTASERRDLNGEFEAQLSYAKIGGFVREFAIKPYRFDFAFPDVKLLIEIDGGNWEVGGHNTGTGHWRDCKKGNLAVIQGWYLLKFITNDVDDGSALTVTETAIAALSK